MMKLTNTDGLPISSNTSKKQEKIPQTKNSIFEIHEEPPMQLALEIISILGRCNKITLRAKGNDISNAVTVSQIMTNRILKGNSRIHKVKVDSEPIRELGSIHSNIEIVLKKIP